MSDYSHLIPFTDGLHSALHRSSLPRPVSLSQADFTLFERGVKIGLGRNFFLQPLGYLALRCSHSRCLVHLPERLSVWQVRGPVPLRITVRQIPA